MTPTLHITDSEAVSTVYVDGATGSQVLANAKRIVEAHNQYAADNDQPGLTVIDWKVTVNGNTVFSKDIEDRRADDMLAMTQAAAR